MSWAYDWVESAVIWRTAASDLVTSIFRGRGAAHVHGSSVHREREEISG